MLLEGVFCIGPGIGIMIFFYPAMESYELNYSLFREVSFPQFPEFQFQKPRKIKENP